MNRSRNIFLLLLCAQLAQGQGGPLQRAERYHASGDLYNAAIQYEQYLGIRKGPSSGYAPYSAVRTASFGGKTDAGGKEAVYARLASCYFELRDYAKASEYYTKAGTLKADDALRQAKSLRALGRLADAKLVLDQLGATGGGTSGEVALELAALNFQPVNDVLTTVSKTAGDANTGHGNYAAVKAGSVLFFTSSRSDSSVNAKGPKRNHLYRIVGTEAILADPLTGQDVDQGLCTFTPDGRRAFFTVWKSAGGKKLAQIYTSTREDGGWTTPAPLGAGINAPGSNNAQPAYLEMGGQSLLYFSSDRAGGAGGYDLYEAVLDAQGAVASVRTLGSRINTPGDEAAPFYHQPTNRLVFASNGRPGLGGFDLYATTNTGQGFLEAEHLGVPINSVKDDSYFYSAAKDSNIFRDAYLSSDRASDCCLEIYSVSRQDPPKPEPKPGPPHTDSVVTPPAVAAWMPPVLLFDFDKADLSGEAKAQLDTVFLQMEQAPAMRLRIGGYTDGKGGESYNNRLSDRRARAVRDYLAAKGITPGRLWIKGFGECCPVAPEATNGKDDAEARRRNRRVELTVEQ